jgi:hypothetical protein
MTYDPWIPLAAQRARILLADGTEATLIGIPRKAGQRARVEYGNGERRTIPLTDIAHVETPT